MGKVYEVVNESLDTRITPLAYLYGIKSVSTGVSYALLSEYSEGVQNTILYKEGALVGVSIWGWLVLIGGVILLLGLSLRRTRMVHAASLPMFMAWAFAAIVYAINGHWIFLFPLAVIELLSCGYLYLSSSLGRLWDYTPSSKE